MAGPESERLLIEVAVQDSVTAEIARVRKALGDFGSTASTSFRGASRDAEAMHREFGLIGTTAKRAFGDVHKAIDADLAKPFHDSTDDFVRQIARMDSALKSLSFKRPAFQAPLLQPGGERGIPVRAPVPEPNIRPAERGLRAALEAERALTVAVFQSERALSRALGSLGPFGRGLEQIAVGSGASTKGLQALAGSADLSVGSLGAIGGTAAGIGTAAVAVSALVRESLALDRALQPVTVRIARTAEQTDALRNRVHALAFAVGTDSKLIAQGLGSAFASGQSTDRGALDLTKLASVGPLIGLGDTSQSVNRIDAITDAFGLGKQSADEMRKSVADVFLAAQEGGQDPGAFFDAVARGGVVATQAGIALKDYSAVLAASADKTGDLGQSVAALNNFIQKTGDPNSPLSRMLRRAQVDASRTAFEVRGLSGVLADVRARIGDKPEALFEAFGSARTGAGVLAAINEEGTSAVAIIDKMTESVNRFNATIDRGLDQPITKLDRLNALVSIAGDNLADLPKRGLVDAASIVVDSIDAMGVQVSKFVDEDVRSSIDKLNSYAPILRGFLDAAGFVRGVLGGGIRSALEAPTTVRGIQQDLSRTFGSAPEQAPGPAPIDTAGILAQARVALQSRDIEAAIGSVAPFERAAVEASQAYTDTLNREIQKHIDADRYAIPANALLLDPQIGPKLSADVKAALEQAAQSQASVRGTPLSIFTSDPKPVEEFKSELQKPLGEFVSQQSVDRAELLSSALSSVPRVLVQSAEGVKELVGFLEQGAEIVPQFKPVIVTGAAGKLQRELDRVLAEVKPPELQVPLGLLGISARVPVPQLEPPEIQKARGTVANLRGFPESDLAPEQKTELDDANDALRRYSASQRELGDIATQSALRQLDGLARIRAENAATLAQATQKLTALRAETNDTTRLAAAEAELARLRASNDQRVSDAESRLVLSTQLQTLQLEQKIGEERARAAALVGDAVAASAAEQDVLRAKGAIIVATAAAQSQAATEGARGNAAIAAEIERQNALREEGARLEGVNLGLARDRLQVERQRAFDAELSAARDQGLVGLDAELAKIERNAAAERRRIDDRVRLPASDPQSLSPEQGAALRAETDTGASDAAALARLDARSNVLDAMLGQARSLVLLGSEAVRVEDAILALEAKRTEELLRQNNATQDELALYARLGELRQRQFAAESGLANARIDPAVRGEAKLLADAVDEVERSFGEAGASSLDFERAALRAFSGPQARIEGTQRGVERLQRYFADDFTRALESVGRQWQSFEEGGVNALRRILDGAGETKEILADFGKDLAFTQLEERFLRPAFAKIGGALFGTPDAKGGVEEPLAKLSGAGDALSQAAAELTAAAKLLGATSPAPAAAPTSLRAIGAPASAAGTLPASVPGIYGVPIPLGAGAPPTAPNTQDATAAGQAFSGAIQSGSQGFVSTVLAGGNAFAGLLGGVAQGLAGSLGQSLAGGISAIFGLARGGIVRGQTVPIQAAGGGVFNSKTLLEVAEIPGLRELVAPLKNGALEATWKNGGLVARVPSGAEVPIAIPDAPQGVQGALGGRSAGVPGEGLLQGIRAGGASGQFQGISPRSVRDPISDTIARLGSSPRADLSRGLVDPALREPVQRALGPVDDARARLGAPAADGGGRQQPPIELKLDSATRGLGTEGRPAPRREPRDFADELDLGRRLPARSSLPGGPNARSSSSDGGSSYVVSVAAPQMNVSISGAQDPRAVASELATNFSKMVGVAIEKQLRDRSNHGLRHEVQRASR